MLLEFAGQIIIRVHGLLLGALPTTYAYKGQIYLQVPI